MKIVICCQLLYPYVLKKFNFTFVQFLICKSKLSGLIFEFFNWLYVLAIGKGILCFPAYTRKVLIFTVLCDATQPVYYQRL